MKMIEKLAYSIGRKDEEPNIELALELITTNDYNGIKEIVDGLNNPTEQIANDCIKVLYEIGERKPELISEYALVFVRLLKSVNNRLVWGAMTALSAIASIAPQEIYDNLETVIKAYENGSVITIDNSISVFAKLAKAGAKYEKKVFPIIIKHLETCRPKEVAQHSERAFVCITNNNSEVFRKTLIKRCSILTDSQKKRVEKLLKRIEEDRKIMTTEILIRKAEPRDAKVLTEISFAAKRYWNYPEEYIEKWKDELTITKSYIKDNIVFTACIDSKIVGFYSIVNNPRDQTFGKIFMKEGYWMNHIFIRPEYIRQGIGLKLINHLKEFCKNSDINILMVFADPNAKGFYEKAGATFKYMSDSSIANRQIPVFEFDF